MRRLPGALLVVGLVGATLWLGYAVVDQSVTLNHQESARQFLTEDRLILKRLLLDLAVDRNRPEVIELLKRQYSSSLIKEEESGIVSVDQVRLVFKDGKLAYVLLSEDMKEQ